TAAGTSSITLGRAHQTTGVPGMLSADGGIDASAALNIASDPLNTHATALNLGTATGVSNVTIGHTGGTTAVQGALNVEGVVDTTGLSKLSIGSTNASKVAIGAGGQLTVDNGASASTTATTKLNVN